MARRPRRRTILAFVATLVLVWLLAAAWMLLDAKSALDHGRTSLASVRNGATPASLLDPETNTGLDAASQDFAHARSRLRSPVLTPLRVLPVIGRHVRAGDRVASSSLAATALASHAVRDLQELSERDLGAGPQRIEVLKDLTSVIDRTREGLERLDPGSPDDLAGPLGDAVAKLDTERDEAVTSLARAAGTTTALAAVLNGPTPYLLIGANNAEMRAGSGMFLSAATLGLDNGQLDLGDVRPTETLVLPAGSVPVTGDLAANWPWLDSGRDLRNMALTADFPQSAELAVKNWALVPGGAKVAGVIVVDVDALRSLLRVVGPVEVGGVRYSADTVRSELLRQQYRRFGADEGDRDQRRDQLGEVAKVVFDRLEAGDWKLADLSSALLDSVQRRNLLVWSADPTIQKAWATTGADGHLRSGSLSVALLNRGAEKLDSYLDTTATLTSKRTGAGRVEVSLAYRITNKAPATGPRYLIGPNIAGMEAGEHRGIAVVNLPAGTDGIRLTGATQTLVGTDGPTAVVAGDLTLKRGESITVRVTGTLPAGVDEVTLEPAARISRTVWTVNGTTYGIDRRRTVTLGG